jgi:hypothetical protein
MCTTRLGRAATEHGEAVRHAARHEGGKQDVRREGSCHLEPDLKRAYHRNARAVPALTSSRPRAADSYTSTRRNRSALPITETELKLMAAAAIIGLRSSPNTGYNTPAAIGTPSAL